MKIRFTEAPKGRDYKVGQIVEFKGPVEETYARKYISRGWAVDVANDPKPEPQPAATQFADRAENQPGADNSKRR